MTVWINLNRTEQKIAEYLAKARYEMNRNNGVENKRIGPQSDEETDLEGIGAEIAFCKMNNIYPDLTLDSHPTEDAVLPNGRRIDIKSTKYNTGHLIAVLAKKNKNPPELYALVVGRYPKYRIAGYVTSEELFNDKNIKDFGYGPTYAMEQDRLFSI